MSLVKLFGALRKKGVVHLMNETLRVKVEDVRFTTSDVDVT